MVVTSRTMTVCRLSGVRTAARKDSVADPGSERARSHTDEADAGVVPNAHDQRSPNPCCGDVISCRRRVWPNALTT